MTSDTAVNDRSSKPAWERSLVAAAVVAAVTVLGYLGWLGWDQKRHRVPGTSTFEGPYETWQVIGLAATLTVLAVVVTWRGQGGAAAVTIPPVLTVSWSIDASGDKVIGANMWPVGAVFLALASVTGVLVVWGVTAAIRRLSTR